MVLPDLSTEISLWKKGIDYVAGIDEVGRGSWAGPLVAAGVILPKDFRIPAGLADSKKVPSHIRETLSKVIKKEAIAYHVAQISPYKIDKNGLTTATNIIFREIARHLKPKPDYCLIDAFYIKYFNRKKQMAVKHGDEKCASIAAASIIAKVYRDNLMAKLGKNYPKYHFEKHKGYGTLEHQEAIKKYGFSKIHRTSYNLGFLFT